MRIAVNAKTLQQGSEEYIFIHECFKRIVAQHPEHQFFFIFNKPIDKEFITAKNISSIIVSPEAKNPLLWQLWYNYKLPAALKKNKIDLLINTDGICSLRTKVPQLLILQDTSFLYYPEYLPKNILRFYKKFTPQFLSKAKNIVTLSQFAKEEIAKKYKIDKEKISIVYCGATSLNKSVDENVKESIKQQYADGKEFFLYSGSAHPLKNLTNLLKAFSFFKKRQKSNMQLLLDVKVTSHYEVFSENLKTYKYRNEVKLLKNLPDAEQAKIMASAYTFVHPVLFENSGTILLQAMQSNIPVITTDAGIAHEICDDAALYTDPASFDDIANKMMFLFKDENKRNELIEKGKQRSQQYNWDRSTVLFWDVILKTVEL